MFIKFFLLMLIFLNSVGCAPSANDIVEDWKARGWKIEKLHGEQGPIERHGKLMSEREPKPLRRLGSKMGSGKQEFIPKETKIF